MREPAGVVEILVQILQNTPILKYSFRISPPPPKMKIVRDFGTLTFQFQNTPPPPENCQRSWHFDFSVSEYPTLPPKLKFRQIRITGTNGKLCLASYHMWRLYPARITTRFV